MELRTGAPFRGRLLAQYQALLTAAGLLMEDGIDFSAALTESGEMIAAGSLRGDLLCCIAVAPDRQGEDLTASVLTALRQEAFRRGCGRLFLCTKPWN